MLLKTQIQNNQNVKLTGIGSILLGIRPWHWPPADSSMPQIPPLSLSLPLSLSPSLSGAIVFTSREKERELYMSNVHLVSPTPTNQSLSVNSQKLTAPCNISPLFRSIDLNMFHWVNQTSTDHSPLANSQKLTAPYHHTLLFPSLYMSIVPCLMSNVHCQLPIQFVCFPPRMFSRTGVKVLFCSALPAKIYPILSPEGNSFKPNQQCILWPSN